MNRRLSSVLSCCLTAALVTAGCERDDMWEQQRTSTLGPSDFYDDNQGARAPVEGTVAQGHLKEDDFLHRGVENGEIATRFPFPITKKHLEDGRVKYDVFCLPCHARVGDGYGMIVQRGFKQPASFHIDRLRNASPGYYYSVLVNGFRQTQRPDADLKDDDKVHPAIAKNLTAEERWSVIAYIRALQLSQNAKLSDVPSDRVDELNKEPTNQESKQTNGTH